MEEIEEIDLKEFHKTLNKLIKNKKISFKFLNNALLRLELLQNCYNEVEDCIELEFRDIMEEHIKELRKIMEEKNRLQ